MRERFLAELGREVLGPRAGIYETMTESPLSEYIAGVLSPISWQNAQSLEDAPEIPFDQEPEGEDNAEDNGVVEQFTVSPALDPKVRPQSFGLMFCSAGEGEISFCLTWARYQRKKQGDQPEWVRQPRYCVGAFQNNAPRNLWIDGSGKIGSKDSAELSLHVSNRTLQNGQSMVAVHIVNEIRVGEHEIATAEHHIYQPQLRLCCAADVRVVPGVQGSSGSAEDRLYAFLYRRRPVLARGFLCSAMWHDIDPQGAEITEVDYPDSVDNAPFGWPDGNMLPETERKHFQWPDVRTDFLPCYSIPSPLYDWNPEYGAGPELHALTLSEAWEPSIIRNALEPMRLGYSMWIEEAKKAARGPEFRAEDGQIAGGLLRGCEDVLARISRGIELLTADEESRLCFAFANRAMAMQAGWKGDGNFAWRTFQLAFIIMTFPSIVDKTSPDRNRCDLLWVPTGAGKTEAYLFLALFSMAYRRRNAVTSRHGTGAGVAVLTRYTLRLLSIQQFRRTLAAVLAADLLRVSGFHAGAAGWRPQARSAKDSFIWGTVPFTVGLWVGGTVTPNHLMDGWGGNRTIPGALSILRGTGGGAGEPAQVMECPACSAILSVPTKGLPPGRHKFWWTIAVPAAADVRSIDLNGEYVKLAVVESRLVRTTADGFGVLIVTAESEGPISDIDVDAFWLALQARLKRAFGVREDMLECMRASRPGYFARSYMMTGQTPREYDFEIACPNPECPTHNEWFAGSPSGSICECIPHGNSPSGGSHGLPVLADGHRYSYVRRAFRRGSPYISDRVPIPAYTVDEQIYHRLPSLIVSTVDKFARPPFEPRSASIFGNVDHHHSVWGYYRVGARSPSGTDVGGHPSPAGRAGSENYVAVDCLPPPDLVMQDELHLIEGPLGSLAGFYETAIDELAADPTGSRPKYVASSATIKRAEEQVQCVFNRSLSLFPPFGLDVDDKFFLREGEGRVLDDRGAGRLYLGVCAPGRGPLTPLVRLMSRLLQTAFESTGPRLDQYWTLTAYFNAVRELAGARALYRQDIPERLAQMSDTHRELEEERCQELSSRVDSTELPGILDSLQKTYPDACDALFTTSMFGTGIDISRIGLMLVNGQPKTTASYIQATGRVGRRSGGLVVTLFRASRPRDLNHFEFFCGYHRQLHRFVEPIAVSPFAPGVIERALGPLLVFVLRNMRNPTVGWHVEQSAPSMALERARAAELGGLPAFMESRAQSQSVARRPRPGAAANASAIALDLWREVASRNAERLKYVEYAISGPPQAPVVLGDAQHAHANLDVVYRNAPQSLREIEETTSFQTSGR